jgi:hypothetical protein
LPFFLTFLALALVSVFKVSVIDWVNATLEWLATIRSAKRRFAANRSMAFFDNRNVNFNDPANANTSPADAKIDNLPSPLPVAAPSALTRTVPGALAVTVTVTRPVTANTRR